MRVALGLRWERAVALVAAILIMLVVALTVVGAMPAQAAEEVSEDDAVVLVVQAYDWAQYSTWGNSWG